MGYCKGLIGCCRVVFVGLALFLSSKLKYTIDDNSDEINNLEQLSKTQYGEIIMQSRGNESVPYDMSKQLMLDPN